MKATVTTRVTIQSSATKVFMYLTDLHYIHLWNPQLQAVSEKKILRLHSTYKTVSRILGVTIEAENRVTKFVQDAELELENLTGTVHYTVNFEVQTKNKSTVLLKCKTTVSSEHKAFAFTAPVLKIMASRELQSDLKSLKVAIENDLTPLAVQ
jgi:uncharacterized membrane protein